MCKEIKAVSFHTFLSDARSIAESGYGTQQAGAVVVSLEYTRGGGGLCVLCGQRQGEGYDLTTANDVFQL